jgi:hypothetical protein
MAYFLLFLMALAPHNIMAIDEKYREEAEEGGKR